MPGAASTAIPSATWATTVACAGIGQIFLNDDRLWAVCPDLEIPVNCRGGQGSPAYAPLPSSAVIMLTEISHYSKRPLFFMLLSGVFERFPRLRFVLTEQ